MLIAMKEYSMGKMVLFMRETSVIINSTEKETTSKYIFEETFENGKIKNGKLKWGTGVELY